MRNRHFRAPLSFDSKKFSRGYKKENKFPISTAVLNVILKGLYLFVLLAIDLILFTSSGNINIFRAETFFSPEIIGLMIAIISFTILLMSVTSFSKPVQDIICAVFTGLFVIVLLTQFAQFDIRTFLGDYLQSCIGSGIPMFFYRYSHIIVAVILSLLVFLIFYKFGLIVLSVYVLLFVIAFAGILRHGFNNNKDQHDFIEIYQSAIKNEDNDDGHKFVYIMLPNLSSYKYLGAINNQEANDLREMMLGFYAKNRFEVFSNAYNENNDTFMNMVRSVNPFSEGNPERHIMSTMLLYKYWKFFNVNDEYVFLRDNQMFDTFRKAGYKISAYKSRGFDLCHKNHMFNVDRCMEKLNRPINLYSMHLHSLERSQILFIEWLSSMKLFKNMSGIYQALRIFGNPEKMPLVGINYNNLYVINSVKTFDILADHILNDKGRQAYFVYADIPSDMFIYDEYCNFKPRDEWINMENMPWITVDNTTEKRKAYIDQSKCLYGKFQEFLDKLEKGGILGKTVIIIEGVSGVDDFQKTPYSDFINNFIYNKLSSLAIKSPANHDVVINSTICQSPTILRNYLYKDKQCEGLDAVNIHPSLKEELMNKLNKLEATPEEAKENVNKFEEWYGQWCQINHIKLQKGIDIIKKGKDDNISETDTETTEGIYELQNELLQKQVEDNQEIK